MQHLMGVSGVIVDLVREITEAVSAFSRPDVEGAVGAKEDGASRPKFSQAELSFLLRLIPELVRH